MEKKLQNSGLYGLLIGLAVSILFVSYKDIQDLGMVVTKFLTSPFMTM